MQPETRRYQVLEAVGRGGFGTVYRAQLLGQGGFRKLVALKVLNPDIAEQGGFAERLRDEARMLGLISHRAVVRVDGLLLLNGRWTVVMEFVEGVDLKRLLGLGPMPVGPALEVVEEVAGALAAAYELPGPSGQPLRLLHRDVKPSNIRLTRTGEVKILDFGVARAEFQHRESVTRSLFFGSLGYMAPERLDGIDTHAGDVYALGAVLYELLTGVPLGRTSGNRERHVAHVQAALARLDAVVRDDEVVGLVRACLAYDDGLRPSARELGRRAHGLRRRYPEPWLKDLAEQLVPGLEAAQAGIRDELSGTVLVEQGLVSGGLPAAASAPGSWRWMAVLSGVLSAGLVIAVGGGLAVALIGVGRDAPAPAAAPAAPVSDEAALTLAGVEADEAAGLPSGAAELATAEAAPATRAGSRAAERAAAPREGEGKAAAPAGSDEGGDTGLADQLGASGGTPAPGAATGSSASSRATSASSRATSASSRSTPAASGRTSTPAGSASASSGGLPAVSYAPAPTSGPKGSVLVSGDTRRVRLVRGGRSWRPGIVAPGTYEVLASFDGRTEVLAGTVQVSAGDRVQLVCRKGLRRCARR